MKIDVLTLLDRMDAFRRKNQNHNNPDYCMRMLEAMLANAAGYTSRNEWTNELKHADTQYKRDLEINPRGF